MTHKERNAIDRAAFQAACLEYRLRCARRVLKLAPLPEFRGAIAALECFQESGDDRRKYVAASYKELSRGKKARMREYGYTALGEIYICFLQILWATLHPKNNIWSGDCQRFVEARYLAAECIAPKGKAWHWASGAQHAEYEYQEEQYKEIFGTYRAEVDARWKKCVEAAA
jgi:hypothetical protein